MIWWAVFLALDALIIAGMYLFVPVEHRRNYARSRKDGAYWLSLLLSSLIWIVAAIQNLIAPASPFPIAMRITGAVALVAGGALQIWAYRVNYFFIPIVIYIPPLHRVKTGPYALCNHPGYIGFVLSACGAAWLLGQWWSVFPLVGYVIVIFRRMTLEDRILFGKVSL